MHSNTSYDGVSRSEGTTTLELHYFDNYGPIAIYIPKEGFELMCGRKLLDQEIETVLLAHEKELHPLIDNVCASRGGFADARWESGVGYRRLDIALEDIEASGIKLSTSVLDTAKVRFADARNGRFATRC
jgi:hypothetical protein